MKRVFTEFFLLVLLFFGTWALAAQFNWMSIFRVKEVSQSAEQKIGELIHEIITKDDIDLTDAAILDPVDSILTRLCQKNGIDRSSIQFYVLENEEVNAFALPNGQLVVLSGLIKNCDNEAELAGVMAHELAHIQLNHVMKKLAAEIGLAAILGATGNSGGQVAKEVLNHLSSTAYGRELETEADLKAVDFLENSGLSAEPFAAFLFRMDDGPDALSWVSTHPGSEERAKKILEKAKKNPTDKPSIIKPATWQKLQDALKD